MALTLAGGPLSRESASTNYRIEGPENRMLFQRFPRRVRAVLAGETILDTTDGKLLHETGYSPQFYLPFEDLPADLLEPSHHTTNCPFKGDASYYSVRIGDRLAENAVWTYEHPLEEASWLRGHAALYWDRVDVWLDEDEPVEGHLPDPYHRVDWRRSSRNVRVLSAGEVVAETTRPIVVSETGEPNRYLVPREDVREGILEPSDTRSVSPYTGRATYWNVRVGSSLLEDGAASHAPAAGQPVVPPDHLAFSAERVEIWVDGRQLA